MKINDGSRSTLEGLAGRGSVETTMISGDSDRSEGGREAYYPGRLTVGFTGEQSAETGKKIEITIDEGDEVVVRVENKILFAAERRSSFLPALPLNQLNPPAVVASTLASVADIIAPRDVIIESAVPRSVVKVEQIDRASFEYRSTHMPELGGPLQDMSGVLEFMVHPMAPVTKDVLTKALDVIERGIRLCKEDPWKNYPSWAGVFAKAIKKIQSTLEERITPSSLVRLVESPLLTEKLLIYLDETKEDFTWRKRILLEQANLAKRLADLEIDFMSMEAMVPITRIKPELKSVMEEALSSIEEGTKKCQETSMLAYPEWREILERNGITLAQVLIDERSRLVQFMSDHSDLAALIIKDFGEAPSLSEKQQMLLDAAILGRRNRAACANLIILNIAASTKVITPRHK